MKIAHKGHAELILMDKLKEEKNNGVNLNLIITTSPCDSCTKRLMNEFNFLEIIYLFNKHKNKINNDSLYKKYKNIFILKNQEKFTKKNKRIN